MSKHDPSPPSTDTPRTEPASQERVPFFARKTDRPVLTVRSGVHGGKEANLKAT